MIHIIVDAILTLVDKSKRRAAKRHFVERIRNAPDRGIKGEISWSREELLER